MNIYITIRKGWVIFQRGGKQQKKTKINTYTITKLMMSTKLKGNLGLILDSFLLLALTRC